jgi:hypothetical protein
MKHRQNVHCMDNVPLMLLSFCFPYKRVVRRSFQFYGLPMQTTVVCWPPWPLPWTDRS